MNKLITPEDLYTKLIQSGSLNVFTGGNFEFIEPSHIDLFEYSKSLGRELIVIMTEKKSIIPWQERLEILASVELIDHLIYNPEFTPEETILKIADKGIIVENNDFTLEGKLFPPEFKMFFFKSSIGIFKSL